MKRLCWLMVLLLAVACGRQTAELPEENSAYYWRTEWQLDSHSKAFIEQHNIRKVYCRYFDVVMTDSMPMPNATIAFASEVPANLQLVPTVFITEDCMHRRHDSLAEKIVSRILQINETHDIGNVSEIQIDCDYTARSRQTFYDFLSEVRHEAQSHGLRLSATIRLHQLSMPVPPVDYGVLMLYNTGDPRKFNERNPVLDLRDVQPYLRRLADYDLPLAAAYPVYCWQRTIYGVHIEHTVAADEILRVKKAVEERRPSLSRSIITYHLDPANIKRYKSEDYEAFYHH